MRESSGEGTPVFRTIYLGLSREAIFLGVGLRGDQSIHSYGVSIPTTSSRRERLEYLNKCLNYTVHKRILIGITDGEREREIKERREKKEKKDRSEHASWR